MQGVYLKKGDFGIFPSGLVKGMNPFQQTALSWIWKHTNEEGQCWPSLRLLVQETGMSRNKLISVLQELEAASLLVKNKRHRADGGLTSTMYQVVAYKGLEETLPAKPAPEARDQINWQAMVSNWNKLAGQYHLKKIRSNVTESRKAHYRARVTECGTEAEFWKIIREELKLMNDWGRSNQPSSFEWIIAKPSNFERFAEGKYRRKETFPNEPTRRIRVAGE